MMRKMRAFLITLLISLTPAIGLSAPYGRKGVGTSGAEFLLMGVNARAIAMGEAYSAVTDQSDSIYWNPAGLARSEGLSLSFMHAVYLQSIFYDWASFSKSAGDFGTFALGVQYLNAQSINETDQAGTNVGTFQPYDSAISVGWAKKFEDWGGEGNFLFGIAGKFIQSRIVEVANTGAADIGLAWNPLEKLWFSMGAQNMGPAIQFKNTSDDLPLNVKIGSSYRIFESFLASLDVNFPKNNDPNLAVGTEYKRQIVQDISFAGRLGFNSRSTQDIDKGVSSISAGFGILTKRYSIDFAWVPFGNLGNSYRVSLSAKF